MFSTIYSEINRASIVLAPHGVVKVYVRQQEPTVQNAAKDVADALALPELPNPVGLLVNVGKLRSDDLSELGRVISAAKDVVLFGKAYVVPEAGQRIVFEYFVHQIATSVPTAVFEHEA